MYQYDKRLDFHALGREIKRKREAKGWTQDRKQIDVMLNSMDEKELIVMESTAEGLKKARGTEEAYECCRKIN